MIFLVVIRYGFEFMIFVSYDMEKINDFLFWLMVTYHILIFRKSNYGGALLIMIKRMSK